MLLPTVASMSYFVAPFFKSLFFHSFCFFLTCFLALGCFSMCVWNLQESFKVAGTVVTFGSLAQSHCFRHRLLGRCDARFASLAAPFVGINGKLSPQTNVSRRLTFSTKNTVFCYAKLWLNIVLTCLKSSVCVHVCFQLCFLERGNASCEVHF